MCVAGRSWDCSSSCVGQGLGAAGSGGGGKGGLRVVCWRGVRWVRVRCECQWVGGSCCQWVRVRCKCQWVGGSCCWGLGRGCCTELGCEALACGRAGACKLEAGRGWVRAFALPVLQARLRGMVGWVGGLHVLERGGGGGEERVDEIHEVH